MAIWQLDFANLISPPQAVPSPTTSSQLHPNPPSQPPITTTPHTPQSPPHPAQPPQPPLLLPPPPPPTRPPTTPPPPLPRPLGLASGLALGGAASAATTRAELTAPITTFIGNFDKGDAKAAAAPFLPQVTIIDEVAPYSWTGPTAFASWARDLAADDAKNGVTGEKVILGDVMRTETDGRHAYVVIAAIYSFNDPWQTHA